MKVAYDEYRNWPLPNDGKSRYFPPDIKNRVLMDLAEAETEVEKMEILDSYEVYVKRAYRREISYSATNLLENVLHSFIQGGIESQIPYPEPISRPRKAERPPDKPVGL